LKHYEELINSSGFAISRWLTLHHKQVLENYISRKNSCAFVHFFLAARGKLRKVTFTFAMFVLPSEWNNSVPAGRIFIKFYTGGLPKYVEINEVWLKSDKINRHFFEDLRPYLTVLVPTVIMVGFLTNATSVYMVAVLFC
jgi:hypothetical protein